MRLLALLLYSIPMLAVTASPTAVTVYVRQYGANPVYASRGPAPIPITISGSGSWDISRGGALSIDCSALNGFCFNAVTTVTTICNGALPTGSGAGSVFLCFNGLISPQLGVGTHTGTLTIGDTAIAITMIVEPALPFDSWTGLPGFPSGCSNSSANYDTTDTCTITDERPTSTAFPIPSPGGSYIDPQFGSRVQRLTASGQNIQYSALTAFSATAKYVMTNDQSGNVNVYNRETSALAYASIPSVNINFASWDPTNDDVIWFMDGNSIKYRNLATSTTTTAATYAYPISMGGTVDITDDGWWAFRDNSSFDGQLCAVDLNGLTTSNQSSKTFCTSMATYSFTDIDFTQITQVDATTRKRYVVAVAAPSAQVFSVGTSGLDYEYAIPTGCCGDVSVEPHSDVGQDAQGNQLFFWSWYDPYGNWYYLGTIYLAKGPDMTQPVEAGGGLRVTSKINPNDFNTDAHYGCTWKGVCVYTPYGQSSGITARQIQSITAANPCQINSTGHGYSTSNSVQIGGALGTGVSAMNNIFTVTVLNANAYTIPVNCSSGWTYTANSAHSAISATVSNNPFRQEIIINRIGQWARRLAIHRTKTYGGGGLSGYFATPRASLSRDGRYIAYASNMGVPEQSSVYVLTTGINSTDQVSTSVDAADTAAVLNYTFPSPTGSATIIISSRQDLASPVVNASDSGTAISRQYIASGLTASTNYWYRISTGQWAIRGQFRTLPALSGTGRLQISKGGGGSIQYGVTTSLGSTCNSPCNLSPSKGLLYHNASGSITATVVK